jgi:Mg-chelatase subunit ChlD
VSALALSSPDGDRGGEGLLLAVGSADGSVRIWRWEGLAYTLLDTIEGNAFDVTAMAFSQDGTLLAAGSEDTKVRLWQVSDCLGATGDGERCAVLLHTLEGHSDRVRRIVFAPDDAWVASAAGESTVYLWDASDGAVYHALEHRAPVNDVAFSPDGALLASGGADGAIALWDVSGRELALDIDLGRTDRGDVQSLAFSPDGVALAYKMADGRLMLLGLRPGSAQGPPSGGVDVVVVLDSSGEVSAAEPVVEAVRGLVQRLRFGSLDVGFVSYASRVEVRETSYRQVVQAIEGTSPGSGTNTADGIRAGTGLLTQGVGPGSLLAGHKVMLLISSGRPDQVVGSACYAQDLYRPNDGSSIENVARDCAMYYVDQARLNRIVIHAIALGEGADHDLLEAIAGRTGGQYYDVPQPGDLQEVLDGVADLVFEQVEQTQ